MFVCGLHRSGTSVLGRNIARFENCTGFRDTGATEDEGQFLQDVYPVAFTLGGPGRFGFDPRAHRTEASALLTPQNVARLKSSWQGYWDRSKTICVEKTPANILMTRFLQAAFPNSYFVVIRRHPVAVSIATQKMWKINKSALHSLFEHWLLCHEVFDQDKQHLERVYELSYEDYVANPSRHHQEIAAFIGTRLPVLRRTVDEFRQVVQVANKITSVPDNTLETVSGAHNEKYFAYWSQLLNHSMFRQYYRHIAGKYEREFNRYGYSLTKGLVGGGDLLCDRGNIPAAVGTWLCLGANACALTFRLAAKAKEQLGKTMPKAVVKKPTRVPHTVSLSEETVDIR